MMLAIPIILTLFLVGFTAWTLWSTRDIWKDDEQDYEKDN